MLDIELGCFQFAQNDGRWSLSDNGGQRRFSIGKLLRGVGPRGRRLVERFRQPLANLPQLVRPRRYFARRGHKRFIVRQSVCRGCQLCGGICYGFVLPRYVVGRFLRGAPLGSNLFQRLPRVGHRFFQTWYFGHNRSVLLASDFKCRFRHSQ